MNPFLSSKSLKIFLSLAIILPSLAFFLSYQYFSQDESSAPVDTQANIIKRENQALMSIVIGEVEAGSPDEGWKSITNGEALNQGEFIRTLGEGRALIQFKNGNTVSLNSNSMVEFNDIVGQQITLTQYSGQVFSRIARSNNSHDVILNDVTFESKGTMFLTQFKNSLPSVDVITSKVNVNSDSSSDLEIEQGKSYSHDLTKPAPQRITNIPSSYIAKDEFLDWNRELLSDNDNIDDLGILSQVNSFDININEPENGQIVTIEAISIIGTTKANSVIEVGGERYGVDEQGFFELNYQLEKGLNTILITAIDDKSNRTTTTLTLEYIPETIITDTTTPSPSNEPVEISQDQFPINLSGKVEDSNLHFRWQVLEDIEINNGFKIVRSPSNISPTFPKDTSIFVEDSDSREFTFKLNDSRTYHFRICIFDKDDLCNNYSNVVTLTTKGANVEVDNIMLETQDLDEQTVSWSVLGGEASEGYRVLWSKDSLTPEYPITKGVHSKYLSNPDNLDTSVNSKSGSGNYYIRVCVVDKNSSCAVYSNTIEMYLE